METSSGFMAVVLIVISVLGIAAALFLGPKALEPVPTPNAEPSSSGSQPSTERAEDATSVLAMWWIAAAVLNAVGVLLIALMFFSEDRTGLGFVMVLVAPFAALAPATIASALNRSARIEALLKSLAPCSQGDGETLR